MVVNKLKHYTWFRAITLFVIVSFTITSMPCVEEARGLAAWAGFQRVTTLRAIEIKTFEEEGFLEFAHSGERKEILKRSSADVQLLSRGKVLVSEALEGDTLKLLRKVVRHQIKAVLSVLMKEEALRYEEIRSLFLSKEKVLESYLSLFPPEERRKLLINDCLDDIAARALELFILRDPRKVLMLENEMTPEERTFFLSTKDVILQNPGLFNEFLLKRKKRELLIRLEMPEEKTPSVEITEERVAKEEKPLQAEKLLSLFGLENVELSEEVKILEEKTDSGRKVVRVKVPEARDKSKIPGRGLDLLKYLLLSPGAYDITTLDLIYNARDELVAVFPVIPKGRKLDEGYIKRPRYLNLSWYNFNVPEIGEKGALEKWERFYQKILKDRKLIEEYRKTAINAPEDMVDEFKPPYVYAEVDTETGEWRTEGLFFLNRNVLEPAFENIPNKKDPLKHQIIVPVFPTVYSPGLHNVLDGSFYSHLAKEFPVEKGSDVLVVGPGSGLDAWCVSLRTGKKVHAIGINPLEVANLEMTARLGNFEVEAITADNIINEEGLPRFKGKKFNLVVWNMPEYAGGKEVKKFKPEPLEVYWDGDPGGRALRRFAGGLPLVLKKRGWAMLWNGSPSKKTEKAILFILGAVGFVKRVKGKAGYYTYFVSPKDSPNKPQEPKEAPRSKTKKHNTGWSRFKVLLSVAFLSLIVGFVGTLAMYALNRSIKNEKDFMEKTGGVDFYKRNTFPGEKEMFSWLTSYSNSVEVGMTYDVEEDGTHRVFFEQMGGSSHVYVPTSDRVIHMHPAGGTVLEHMPSLQDLAVALEEPTNVVVLTTGKVVKLERTTGRSLDPFERILDEGKKKINSFLKERDIYSPALENMLLQEVVNRIILDRISDWDLFDVGAGPSMVTYYNPNAWGYLVRLFGYEITEFENGKYTDFWQGDEDTILKIEELKKRGDEFYEDFQERADKIIRDKFERSTGMSASRVSNSALSIFGTILAALPFAGTLSSKSGKKPREVTPEEGIALLKEKVLEALSGERDAPYIILFKGDPGTGKSTVKEQFAAWVYEQIPDKVVVVDQWVHKDFWKNITFTNLKENFNTMGVVLVEGVTQLPRDHEDLDFFVKFTVKDREVRKERIKKRIRKLIPWWFPISRKAELNRFMRAEEGPDPRTPDLIIDNTPEMEEGNPLLRENKEEDSQGSLSGITPIMWVGIFALLLFKKFNPSIFFIWPLAILSITAHEFAHAWVAYKFGDMTAKRMGRLTLNPLKHVDLVGTIIIPLLLGIGWAKPIPINTRKMTKKEHFLTALAGPLANLSIGLVFMGLYYLLSGYIGPVFSGIIALSSFLNFLLAGFNLLPIPPFDGSRIMRTVIFPRGEKNISPKKRFIQFGKMALYFAGMISIGNIGLLMWPETNKVLLQFSEYVFTVFPSLFQLSLLSGQLTSKKTEGPVPEKVAAEESPENVRVSFPLREEVVKTLKCGKKVLSREEAGIWIARLKKDMETGNFPLSLGLPLGVSLPGFPLDDPAVETLDVEEKYYEFSLGKTHLTFYKTLHEDRFHFSVSNGEETVGHGIFLKNAAGEVVFRYRIHGGEGDVYDFRGRGHGKETLALILSLAEGKELFPGEVAKISFQFEKRELSEGSSNTEAKKMASFLERAGLEKEVSEEHIHYVFGGKEAPSKYGMEKARTEEERSHRDLVIEAEKEFFSKVEDLEKAVTLEGIEAADTKEFAAAEETYRSRSIILYADDILHNASVVYLERTLKKMFSEGGVLKGGKVVIFAREESNATILKRLIKRAGSNIETVTILEEDLRNTKGTEAGEIDGLINKARSKGAGKVIALIKKKDGNFKKNSPEDLKKLSRKLKLPVVLIGGAENSIYSFSEAIEKALSILEAAERGGVRKINWVKILQPIRRITEDIKMQHKEYLRTLNFLVAA